MFKENLSPIVEAPIEQMDFEELTKRFTGLKLESNEAGQVSCAMAVLNVGQNEKSWAGKKCDIPVIRLEFQPENENFAAQIKIENGQTINAVNLNKALSQDELIRLMEQLNDYSNLPSNPMAAVDETASSLAEKLKTDFGLEISISNLEREQYLPYDRKAEVNEDNLKSLDWLKDKHKDRIEQPVDQGSEKLFIIEVGGKEFEFLESGDMYFIMNNTPTMEFMDAAISEGLFTEQDKADYISLKEEADLVEKTKEKYKAEGEKTGQEKDYRENDYWATAKANYKYDAVRQLNYLEIGGEPVMDEFERDYIQLLGANVARYDSAVMEVGFGMGISANAIQEKLLEVSKEKQAEAPTHIIIEYNHEVAEKARDWAKRQKITVVIMEGDWQKEIQKIPDGILTAALADPYPLSPEEKHEDAARPLQEIHKKLRPGGVVSYYPDSQYCLSKRHAELAEQAGFHYIGSVTSRFAKKGKNTGEYYDPRLRMAIPALYKDGGTGSAEREKLQMSEEKKKEIIKRLFIENPRQAREELLKKAI